MQVTKRALYLALVVSMFAGCKPPVSTLETQIKVCTEEVKLGLGDPGSLEIVSSEGISVDKRWFRVKLSYTAKNAMGGRVRASALCGFVSKESTVLNADDFVNQERQLKRDLNAIGIK